MHCFRGGCLFFELRNNIIYNFFPVFATKSAWNFFATTGCEK